MLHLYKVIYEEIDYKELPEKLYDYYCNEIKFELYDLYNDEIIFYVLAESSSEASEMAWFSLPEALEDYFEEANSFDVQNCFMEDEFINNYQEELKMARNDIVRINGYLSNKQEEYFNTYLKED
jgi:hypothetical protein